MNALKHSAAKIVSRGLPYLPYLSLASGIAGAFLMKRSPAFVPFLFGAFILALVMLMVFERYGRTDNQSDIRWHKVRYYGLLLLIQSLLQQALFFVLPFYLYAMDWGLIRHLLFFVALVCVSGLTLWDPSFEKGLHNKYIRNLFLIISSVTALHVGFGLLGVPTEHTWWLATGCMMILTFVSTRFRHSKTQEPEPNSARSQIRQHALTILAGCGCLLMTAHVPPAPLKITYLEVGTDLEDYEVNTPYRSDAPLNNNTFPIYCSTHVYAPLGLEEELIHTWWHNGEQIDSIPLRVRGGRKQGFRTYSRKSHFPSNLTGRFSCRIENARHQILAERSFWFAETG